MSEEQATTCDITVNIELREWEFKTSYLFGSTGIQHVTLEPIATPSDRIMPYGVRDSRGRQLAVESIALMGDAAAMREFCRILSGVVEEREAQFAAQGKGADR